MKIPLSMAHVSPNAYVNIKKVLDSRKLSGDGFFCKSVEEKLKRLFKINHAMLTTSCTHALEMSLLVLDLKPDDEVILPSFTFTSTANAVLIAGAKPIFCEVNSRTLNMDPIDVAKRITKKTKAIIPVHYAGVGCKMDALIDLCKNNSIAIIEDAAHAIGAKWNDINLGSIGDLSALSFHETKNIVCGEGGALLTNNDYYAEKACIIREKGTNRTQFLKGQVDKYTWIEKGSSYILAEPLSAILDAEIDVINELNFSREICYKKYTNELADLEKKGVLTLPFIPPECQSNYHLFHIILPNETQRNSLMSHLREKKIGATFHYIPLHTAPAGLQLGYKVGDFPITEDIANRLLRLPLYPEITNEQICYIITEIYDWAKRKNK